jgi:hypothetical protein
LIGSRRHPAKRQRSIPESGDGARSKKPSSWRRFASASWIQTLLLIVFCFTASAADVQGLLRLDGRHVKWGRSAYDAGAEVTYAYLTEVRTFSNARNCEAMLPINVLLNLSRIDHFAFQKQVRAAFAVLSEQADLRFRYTKNPDKADILIGALDSSYGVAFTNVFRKGRSNGPIAEITRATICLDPTESWELGRDGNPATYNLRRVLAHEIGHALGLDHLGPAGGLMGYEYPEPKTGPLAQLEAADRAAIVRLYGPEGDRHAAATVTSAGVSKTACETLVRTRDDIVVECALAPRQDISAPRKQ